VDDRLFQYAPERDIYRLLQVDPRADTRTILAACRRLARHYHPDFNPSPRANEEMQVVNAVRRIMTNPATRARYDLVRSGWWAAQAAAQWPEARLVQPTPSRASPARRRGIPWPSVLRRPERAAAPVSARAPAAGTAADAATAATAKAPAPATERPRPVAVATLARSHPVLLFLSIGITVAGLAAALSAPRALVIGGGGPASWVLALLLIIDGAALAVGGVALAAALLTVRLEIWPGIAWLRWLGGSRLFALVPGPITRVSAARGQRPPFRPQLAFGELMLGTTSMPSGAAAFIVKLGRGPLLAIPTAAGRLVVVPEDEGSLIGALEAASRPVAPAEEEETRLLTGIERVRREEEARRPSEELAVEEPVPLPVGRTTSREPILVPLLAVVVLLVGAAAAAGFAVLQPGTADKTGSATPTGGVAGGRGAPGGQSGALVTSTDTASSTPEATAMPTPTATARETATTAASPARSNPGAQAAAVDDGFDDLPLGPVPSPWKATTDGATFEVVPLPTAVRRSASLSAEGTEAAEACRALEEPIGPALTIESAFSFSAGVAGWELRLNGASEELAIPVATAGLEPDQWLDLELVVGEDGYELNVTAEGGRRLTMDGPAPAEEPIESLCVAIPRGGGAVYLDALRVTEEG